jgi:4-hydroxy-2-oxoheptanedioate aldolase
MKETLHGPTPKTLDNNHARSGKRDQPMNGKDLLEKMKGDNLVLSMSLRLGMGVPAIEVAKEAGFDFLYVDFEHGVVEMETFARIVREAKQKDLLVLCRAPGLDVGFINRVLDAGANGVVFPHIKTREEAVKAVELLKFRTEEIPFGRRGFEPAYGLAKLDYEGWDEYFHRVNEETLVGLMIEDKEGVENIEEILSVKGVNLVYIGKMDMAFSYGVSFTPLAGRDDPIIEDAIEKVLVECKKRGMPVRFTIGRNSEEIVSNANHWIPLGRAKTFMVNDQALLMQGAKNYVTGLKDGLSRPLERMK